MTDSRDDDRPGAHAPRERREAQPQRVYGTPGPWTSQGTGAQRFTAGDPVRLRTAGVVDDLDPDDGVHVRFDTSGAWMQPDDLEPPPPVGSPAVKPTPDWMLRGGREATRARLAEVVRERDQARAKVARVEALLEANSRAETVYVARVRAALAGPDDAGTVA